MSDAIELPHGWAKTRVDAIVQLVNGFAFKPTQWKSEGLPIIRIQNLNNPDASFNYCPENLPDKIRVRNGDLLFAWSGTPGTSFGAHIWRGDDAWLNQHIFKVLFHREHLDVRFLRLAINQNLDSYIRQAHGGAGLAHITKGRFEESELYIAPLNEQSRIVAKIEELFSDLDAGVAALKRAKANLKRYRASVLKAAVEGKLTEQWRAKHPAIEPASALLARILLERRQKWEADQLAKFAAAKKESPKNWRDKYVEPTPPDTTGLPELPEGWCWATLDQLLNYLRNGYFQSPTGADSGTPILRINAVRPMKVDLAESRFLNEIEGSVDDHFIENGDLLFTRYNGSVDLLGVAGMVRGCTEKVLHPDKLIRVKLILGEPLPSFIEVAANIGESRKHMVGRARTTAGQKGVSGPDVREMPIPLPPLAEQACINTEVATKLSQIDAAEKQIEHGLLRAARLRQSILKRAFEGKLVPQDPKDEPASALLERLRTSRTIHEGSGNRPSSSIPRRSKSRGKKS